MLSTSNVRENSFYSEMRASSEPFCIHRIFVSKHNIKLCLLDYYEFKKINLFFSVKLFNVNKINLYKCFLLFLFHYRSLVARDP